ncbi:type II toxin-antitoxin system Phd/YefM family antitoxin [Rhizobium sp.]
MRVSLAEAESKLEDLARQAENGDDIVLTRDGQDIIRLVPVQQQMSIRERRRLALEALLASAKAKGLPDDGADAAHSQDFLYDEYGLPK